MKSFDLLVRNQGFFVGDGIYGFYTDCSPSNVNDLRRQGTGEFFFEISDDGIEIKDGGVLDQRMLNCLSIRFDEDGEDIFLRFGRASLAEYKKVYELPERLVAYLKEERPEVYEVYCELTKNGK